MTQNPLKLWGSYVGVAVGFIVALQVPLIRAFVIRDVQEIQCSWTPCASISCGEQAATYLLLLLIAGFLVGWGVHATSQKSHKEKSRHMKKSL